MFLLTGIWIVVDVLY